MTIQNEIFLDPSLLQHGNAWAGRVFCTCSEVRTKFSHTAWSVKQGNQRRISAKALRVVAAMSPGSDQTDLGNER